MKLADGEVWEITVYGAQTEQTFMMGAIHKTKVLFSVFHGGMIVVSENAQQIPHVHCIQNSLTGMGAKTQFTSISACDTH